MQEMILPSFMTVRSFHAVRAGPRARRRSLLSMYDAGGKEP